MDVYAIEKILEVERVRPLSQFVLRRKGRLGGGGSCALVNPTRPALSPVSGALNCIHGGCCLPVRSRPSWVET